MGNFSIYLTDDLKEKLARITHDCNIEKSKVLRILFRNVPESYIKDVVNTYKDNEERFF